MSLMHRMPATAGVGLRLPHLEEAVATRPTVGWLEIHPENFVANPHATELLVELAEQYPISVHTVGLSVGSVTGIDRHHMARVGALIDRIDPVLVSGHLAWSTHGAEYLNDLLPLPYTEETLRIVAEHLHEVQDGLGRPFLLENPSSYVGFTGSTMTEVQFLNELVDRTGCLLLCDVSNVYLSGHNMGYDAEAYLAALPAAAVAELHLGGFTVEDDEATPGGQILIDTHANRVAAPAWKLYARAVRRFERAPVLIEWDNDIPALATLLEEAGRADEVARLARGSEVSRDVAC
jgi:uncharacterized protein (UPF0276 family)